MPLTQKQKENLDAVIKNLFDFLDKKEPNDPVLRLIDQGDFSISIVSTVIPSIKNGEFFYKKIVDNQNEESIKYFIMSICGRPPKGCS